MVFFPVNGGGLRLAFPSLPGVLSWVFYVQGSLVWGQSGYLFWQLCSSVFPTCCSPRAFQVERIPFGTGLLFSTIA